METYLDIDNDSGVVAYELGPGRICVQFEGGATYLYTNESAGEDNIAEMHRLARAGNGLNSFINRYVKYDYAGKGC